MFTVTSVYTSEYRIKSSRFLGYLCSSLDTNETDQKIHQIKKEHSTATHHCYAYILNPNSPVEFATDDGEPHGSAGLPILNTLKSYNLVNATLCVVRYYGGTKLGKSGLIQAYQTAAEQVIDSATLKTLKPIKVYRIDYDYSLQSLINSWKSSFSLIELDSTYLENVQLIIGCHKSASPGFEQNVLAHEHQLIRFDALGNSFHIEK